MGSEANTLEQDKQSSVIVKMWVRFTKKLAERKYSNRPVGLNGGGRFSANA